MSNDKLGFPSGLLVKTWQDPAVQSHARCEGDYQHQTLNVWM
jgi:hypothetical protein